MPPKQRYQIHARPLEKHWKDWIVVWRDDGKTYEEIINLLAERKHHATKSLIKRVLEKEFEPWEYRPVSIRDMELFASIRDSVIKSYLDDSQATLQSVQTMIKNNFNEDMSVGVVRRIREECGFRCYNTRYGHSVRLVNRPLRLAFCQEQIAADNMFTHHVFTDECCVQLAANNRFVFCLRGDVQRRVKSVHKNPVKVMIWGGVSWRGATPLIMFESGTKIDNKMYQAVLETGYKNWARDKFGGNSILVQDNAPCHTAAATKAYLLRENIKVMDWPPESPDINAVEVVWANLKRWLQNTWKPQNLKHLKEGIAKWWKETLTQDKCREYIRRVQPQMRKVIDHEGGPVHS